MLKDGAWLRHARHANEMAKRLEAGLRTISTASISFPVQSNTVLAKIPVPVEAKLRERGWQFFTGGITPEDSRFMCSWDTTQDDVDALVADLRDVSS
jgi:threonine aldolase